MQKESSRILFIEILLLIISFWGLLTSHFNLLLYLLLLIIPLMVSLFLLGIYKRGERLTKDSLLMLLIGAISYYLITYVIGYFVGFLRTGYSHNIGNIFYNVVLWSSFVIIVELIRGMIIKKGKYYKKLIILSIFIFSLVETVTAMSIYNIVDKRMLFDVVFSVIAPILSKNVLMTYVCYHTSYKNNIVYRLLMEIPIYIVPIIPNIGDYLRNLYLIMLPILLVYWQDNTFFINREIKDGKKLHRNSVLRKICDIIITIVLVIMIILVSGIFRFAALTIGSGSMEHTIDKGDIVIIDKNSNNYEVGDIIAFRKGGRILVHRIIYKSDNGYNTQGDNNNHRDNWLVKDNDVIGKYIFKVKYIGWITVKVNEWLSGGV